MRRNSVNSASGL